MTINYTITMQSDAQIGSGAGGEVINNYVTRDVSGNPVIRASHLKGVLRQTLTDIVAPLKIGEDLLSQAFGQPGWRPEVSKAGQKCVAAAAALQFRDAVLQATQMAPVRSVTRTALDPITGSIRRGSLRTTEAICAGTVFKGTILGCDMPAMDVLIRLALLSLRSLGGSRNRGAGCCVAEIATEQRSPGQLLQVLRDRGTRLFQGLDQVRGVAVLAAGGFGRMFGAAAHQPQAGPSQQEAQRGPAKNRTRFGHFDSPFDSNWGSASALRSAATAIR